MALLPLRTRRDGVLGRLDAFDEAVDAWLEPRRSATLDHAFFALSSAADHSLLWLAIGAAKAARSGEVRPALRLGAALGIESALTNGVVKTLFGRVRPSTPPPGPLPYGLHRPITSSFPSGHATAAFTAATFLAEDSACAPAWYGLATLVAASRVYVRMHHASDVVAGAALGIAVGHALRRALPRPADPAHGRDPRAPSPPGGQRLPRPPWATRAPTASAHSSKPGSSHRSWRQLRCRSTT